MNSQCWCPAERFHSFIRVIRSGGFFLSFPSFLYFIKIFLNSGCTARKKKKKCRRPWFPLIQVSTPNQCRKKNGTKVPLVARGDIAGISLFFFPSSLFTFSTPPSPLDPLASGKKLVFIVTMGLNPD